MRKLLFLATALSVGFLSLGIAGAETYDQRKAREYKQALGVCGEESPFTGQIAEGDCFQKPPADLYANGKVLAGGPAQFIELNKYVKAWKKKFDWALQQWNSSPRFRKTFPAADRKLIIAALKARQAYYIEMAESLKGSADGIQAKQDGCRSFKKQVLTRDLEKMMKVLIAQKNMGDESYPPEKGRYIQALRSVVPSFRAPKEVIRMKNKRARHEAERALRAVAAFDLMRTALDTIAVECENPENEGIGVSWCVDRHNETVTRPKDDKLALKYVRSWCIVATEREALLEGFLRGFIADDLEKRQPPFGPGPRIKSDEPIYLSDLELTAETKKKILASYAAVQEAAALQVEISDELLAPLAEKFAEVRARIDEIAASQKLPKSGKSVSYAKALAKKAVKARYPKASVKKSGMTDADWNIKKSHVGIPLDRSRYGWVEYKVKGEKWCRVGYFKLTEQFDGKFQRDTEVVILDETFLKCQ